jgi:hypothetical protein
MRFWTRMPGGTRLESGSPAMIKALQPQHLKGTRPAPCTDGTAHCRALEFNSYATHHSERVKNVALQRDAIGQSPESGIRVFEK